MREKTVAACLPDSMWSRKSQSDEAAEMERPIVHDWEILVAVDQSDPGYRAETTLYRVCRRCGAVEALSVRGRYLCTDPEDNDDWRRVL